MTTCTADTLAANRGLMVLFCFVHLTVCTIGAMSVPYYMRGNVRRLLHNGLEGVWKDAAME